MNSPKGSKTNNPARHNQHSPRFLNPIFPHNKDINSPILILCKEVQTRS
uniref:Uncharacterized protein n=1 Tax=Rhizophora mucronata TaxID=61149 RepID=A0A2P2Q897_RHIMU